MLSWLDKVAFTDYNSVRIFEECIETQMKEEKGSYSEMLIYLLLLV